MYLDDNYRQPILCFRILSCDVSLEYIAKFAVARLYIDKFSTHSKGHIVTGPNLKITNLKVPSDRLDKPGIKPVTPGLQGKWLIHYTMAARDIISL